MKSNSKMSSFNLTELPDSRKFLKHAYNKDGIIYLQQMLDYDQLEGIRAEIDCAESEALDNLKKNWGNRSVCFFTNNPDNQQKLDNAEGFVNEKYFQESDDKIHAFFEEIDGKLRLNRLGHGLHRQPKYLALNNLIYKNENLSRL